MEGESFPQNKNNNTNYDADGINAFQQELSASLSAPTRTGSLLERIRAQRDQEEALLQNSNAVPANESNQAPPPTNMDMSDNENNTNASNISSFSVMNYFGGESNGLMSSTNPDNDLSEGLLSSQEAGMGNATSIPQSEEYSMKQYFLTFVMDMYVLFQKMPVYGQAISVIFLLWLVIKLV